MFNEIARDWHRKRKRPWKPFVKKCDIWISRWLKSEYNINDKRELLFIDLGCGSGRHTEFFQSNCGRLIEMDDSINMLKLNPIFSHKVQAQMPHLPFRDKIFDGIFSVAAIHHVKGESNRGLLKREITRIGFPSALFCCSVWRFYQKKFYAEFIRQLSLCPPFKGNFSLGDVFVPWTISQAKKRKTVERYYHLFRAGEFREYLSSFKLLKFSTMGKPKNNAQHPQKHSEKKDEGGGNINKNAGNSNQKKGHKNNFFFAGIIKEKKDHAN